MDPYQVHSTADGGGPAGGGMGGGGGGGGPEVSRGESTKLGCKILHPGHFWVKTWCGRSAGCYAPDAGFYSKKGSSPAVLTP